jgi:hypothetical protein
MAAPAKQFRVLRLVNSVIAAFALMYAVGLLVQGVSLINRIGA